MNEEPKSILKWPFEIFTPQMLTKIVLKGDPLPAPRPRFVGHAYMPTSYTKYKDALGWHLREMLHPMDKSYFFHEDVSLEDRVFGVRAFFFRRTRQRADPDNLLKTVLDAGTKVIWPDDSQVVEVFARIWRESKEPRVEVLIYELEPEGLTNCSSCGKPFRIKSGRKGLFCGRQCRANAIRSKRLTAECEQCHQAFSFPPSLAKVHAVRFCSRLCNILFHVAKRRAAYSPKLCIGCGQRVSRPEYPRCRACWRSSFKSPYKMGLLLPAT